jgi:hypothetical protein
MFEIILNMLQINTAKGILDTILSVQPKESAGGKAGDTRWVFTNLKLPVFSFGPRFSIAAGPFNSWDRSLSTKS